MLYRDYFEILNFLKEFFNEITSEKTPHISILSIADIQTSKRKTNTPLNNFLTFFKF